MNLKDKLKNLGKKNPNTLGLASTLKFGKYKNRRINDIIEEDPKYLEWAVNDNVILLDDEAYTELQDAIVLTNTEYSVEDFL